MTTDTLTFKQLDPTYQESLLAKAQRLISEFVQHNAATLQGNCQVRPPNTDGESVLGLYSTGCDGEIIFHVLAAGVYPTRKLF